jgi:hypothetical protein
VNINTIVDNSPVFKLLLKPLKQNILSPNFEEKEEIMDELLNNKKLIEAIKEDVSILETPLENLEKLDKLDPSSDEYKNLYDDVISVGEYKILSE